MKTKHPATKAEHETTKLPHAQKPTFNRTHGYKTVMHHVENELSSYEIILSRILHNPLIHVLCEALSRTILRPSGLIGALLVATPALLVIHIVASYAGFSLSGTEVGIFLAIGFCIGITCEILQSVFKRTRSSH